MREQIVGMITPTMAVGFFILFLMLWQRGRMGNYVLAFALSYLFFAAGFLVTHLADTAATYTWHVTQFFYTVSLVMVSWGLAKRANQPTLLGAFVIVYLLAAVTLGVALVVDPAIGTRLIIVNIAYGVIKLMTMMVLIGSSRRDAIDKLLIAVQAIIAAQFFIRPTLTLMFEQQVAASDYRDTVYYSILNLSVSLISVAGALVLVGACIYDQVCAVRQRAEVDALTGLRTRRAFENDVVAMLERAKAEDIPVSLVVADLDHFKAVNDVWGHQIGDRAIAAFGRIIEETIRDADVAGRIGGEEFCVLAWNCEGEAAVAMANRIRQRLSVTMVEGMPDNHRLTASFGIAGRGEGEGYGKLFARSDSALYRAKESGRDRAILDTKGAKGGGNVTELLTDEAALREARS
ncbi:MAG: diguanylate cyclase [Qipengyuania vulgaris]